MKSSKVKEEKKKWKRLSKQQAHALWLNKVEIRYTNARENRSGTWGTHYSPLHTGLGALDDATGDTHRLYRFWVEAE